MAWYDCSRFAANELLLGEVGTGTPNVEEPVRWAPVVLADAAAAAAATAIGEGKLVVGDGTDISDEDDEAEDMDGDPFDSQALPLLPVLERLMEARWLQ